jgi:signal transduction histidine kinase
MGFAVIALFAGSSMWLTARTIQREEATILERTAHRLAADLDDELKEEGDLGKAAAAVLEQEAASGFRIDIVDAAGRILASTSRRDSGIDVRQVPGSGNPRAIVPSASGAAIVVSVSPQLRMATLAALGRALLLAAVPLLLLTLILSRRLITRALRPLREMEHRAREASIEEAVRSIGPTFGLAEIDALRLSFDHLLARLDDLLQSERRFTSDASHELRTPLTVLSGEMEMALASTDLPPQTRSGLERASEQVRTMRELVEALLLLRRAGAGSDSTSGTFEPVNLTDLAGETLRAAALRNPARRSDLCISGPDEVLALGHPTLLGSALRNLIENAIKFTEAGQPIRITVDAGSEEACVTVDDGGSGVPAGERGRIFDPFFRGAEARAARHGTGLGLPILRQVARAHGGEVSVEDSPLGGARFTLRLPLLKLASGSGP